MSSNENIVKLDIGGTVFNVSKSTLTKHDGMFKTMLETEFPINIDRSSKHFDAILNFMRDGHVDLPESSEEIKEILKEAEFYLLDELVELCNADLEKRVRSPVDDLTSNIKKLKIDPKIEKNWCNLPPEMKLECIKTMKFKMRYLLRGTSLQERDLVDSLRYKFDELLLSRNFFCMHNDKPKEYCEIQKLDGDYVVGYYGFDVLLPLLTYVLNKCDFNRILIGNKYLLEQISMDDIKTVLKPKSIVLKYYCDINNYDFESTLVLFKKCWNNVEKISIEAPKFNLSFDELFKIPSVINSKMLYIHNSKSMETVDQFFPLIEKWIENDMEVGTKLVNIITRYRFKSADSLFDKFQDKQISRHPTSMRIRTDTAEKHILMTVYYRKGLYFVSVVIPSNLLESEYGPYTLPYSD